jgi:hypothetical protein|tara:strand:- start:8197 stop:9201 length:1005 start_codon:yes stop_codon:yes gene_type:complete
MEHMQPQKIFLNPSPGCYNNSPSFEAVDEAFKALEPSLRVVQERIASLPQKEVFDPETNTFGLARIVTYAQMTRILMQVCGGRLIVHSHIANAVEHEVQAELWMLTKEGYHLLATARADVGPQSMISKQLLEAESRAKRRVLRRFRLFSDQAIERAIASANRDFQARREENEKVESQHVEKEEVKEDAEKSPVIKRQTRRTKKPANKEGKSISNAEPSKDASLSDKQKSASSGKKAQIKKETAKAAIAPATDVEVGKPGFGVPLEDVDRDDINFRENLLNLVKEAKEKNHKSVKVSAFIKRVVGDRGPNSFRNMPMMDLEKLYENYVANEDCPL